MLKDVIRFSENQEKVTYGIIYKLSLTRNKDEAVFDKAVRIADGRVKIHQIHRFVPNYTPSIQQEGVFSKQILTKRPTEHRYIERTIL